MTKYTYTDELGQTVTATSYRDAARELYGQHCYPNPHGGDPLETTYIRVRRGYAEIRVYQLGDRQGPFRGVRAANPARHTLRRVRTRKEEV